MIIAVKIPLTEEPMDNDVPANPTGYDQAMAALAKSLGSTDDQIKTILG